MGIGERAGGHKEGRMTNGDRRGDTGARMIKQAAFVTSLS
jgi:hypothetical protein